MKYFDSLLKQIVRNDKKVLGRWNIIYCDKKINNKIDLSNEDHCGPCGQYVLNKQTEIIKQDNPTINK
jgi:hypothetical protein